jgi:NTE family protein
LEAFWRSVSRAALLSPLRRGFLDVLLDRWSLDHSPVFVATDMMARLFSPYDLNPGGSTRCGKSSRNASTSSGSGRRR